MRCQRQQRKQERCKSGVSPGLQGTDGVDLRDVNNGAHCFERGAAAFSNLRMKIQQQLMDVSQRTQSHITCRKSQFFLVWQRKNWEQYVS